MARFICVQCGTQYPESAAPPAACPICEDVRQYVRWEGQAWTTLEELTTTHSVTWEDDCGLIGIGSKPSFGIGQRALLVQTPDATLMWDCTAIFDAATIDRIKAMGGLTAIAISHPHYYTTMVAWSEALGGVPIYLHADDREWVQHPSPFIHFWEGETLALAPSLTLLRCPGHFAGGTVLHWRDGADGKGALLAGDILQVTQDRRFVSFMFSYPNLIPVNASTVRRIAANVEPLAFDRLYGAWWNRNIESGAKQAVRASAERYIRAISEG